MSEGQAGRNSESDGVDKFLDAWEQDLHDALDPDFDLEPWKTPPDRSSPETGKAEGPTTDPPAIPRTPPSSSAPSVDDHHDA
jgi:hypothetical protein